MKKDKLITGLILVAIGAAFLLNNFGLIHFHWANIIHLWPIFLVIAGVNLVLSHNEAIWATATKIGVAVIGIGLILFGNFDDNYKYWPGSNFFYHHNMNSNNNDNDNDDSDDNADNTKAVIVGDGNFSQPYNVNAKNARLDISGGGTLYTLNDTTNLLFKAFSKDKHNKYSFSQYQDDSVYAIDFHMKNKNGLNLNTDKNQVNFFLNPNPEWQIHVETGASKLNFNLTKFKIRSLELRGGAASFDVKLGKPLSMTDVDVETGVSGVDISIPKDAACSIETESGLSDNHFEGFNKSDENSYETAGYQNAKTKIHIHISGGLSDFHVKRY